MIFTSFYTFLCLSPFSSIFYAFFFDILCHSGRPAYISCHYDGYFCVFHQNKLMISVLVKVYWNPKYAGLEKSTYPGKQEITILFTLINLKSLLIEIALSKLRDSQHFCILLCLTSTNQQGQISQSYKVFSWNVTYSVLFRNAKRFACPKWEKVGHLFFVQHSSKFATSVHTFCARICKWRSYKPV